MSKRPRCVASTQDLDRNGYFQAANWSPDGTCIITNDESNTLQTFIVPPDLLDSHDEPAVLTAYTTHISPEPMHAWTPYPGFDLSNTSSTLVLSSPVDHPIRLTNVLSPGRLDDGDENVSFHDFNPVVATYPLIDPITEKWLTPSSLLFPPTESRIPGSSFLAGAHSLLAVFDVTRPGQEPVHKVKTIPSVRKKIKGGGVGIKGIISALACSDVTTGEGLVAAGTWTRNVGLYTSDSALGQHAVWTLREDAWASSTSDRDPVTGTKVDIGGTGVDKLQWSPCGRYLYVFERHSDGGLVYDVRVLGKKLGTMTGRGARTSQRLGACVVAGDVSDVFLDGWSEDVFNGNAEKRPQAANESHHDIYTTSTTGSLNIYRNPHLKEGIMGPDGTIPELHGDAIGGLSMHPFFGVLATASGQRHGRLENDDSDSDVDSVKEPWEQSLKIWANQRSSMN